MKQYKNFNYEALGVATLDESRNILIPQNMINITMENNSTYIYFEIPNTWQGISLYSMDSIAIVSVNPNGATSTASDEPINVSYNEAEDKLKFGWLITKGTTAYAGPIQFEIRIAGKIAEVGNDTPPIDYMWKTQVNTQLTVLQGIDEVVDSDWFVATSDIVSRLQQCEDTNINQTNDIKSINETLPIISQNITNNATAISKINTTIEDYATVKENATNAKKKSEDNAKLIDALQTNDSTISQSIQTLAHSLTGTQTAVETNTSNILSNIEKITSLQNEIGTESTADKGTLKSRIATLEEKQTNDIDKIAGMVTNNIFGLVSASKTLRTKDIISPQFTITVDYPKNGNRNNWILTNCKVKVLNGQYYAFINSAIYNENNIEISLVCNGITLPDTAETHIIFDCIFQKVTTPQITK